MAHDDNIIIIWISGDFTQTCNLRVGTAVISLNYPIPHQFVVDTS